MRDHCLKVYVNEDDKEYILHLAQEAGLSISSYLARCGSRRKVTSHIDRQSISHLMKINADLARLGNLMKFTMTELSDETDEKAKSLTDEAYSTLGQIREIQSTLKAKIAEISA